MASSIFPKVYNHLLKGDVDLDTADVKVMLLGGAGAYSFDASDEFVSDLVSAELSTSGTGYSRKSVSVTLTDDCQSGDDADAGVFVNFDLTGDAEWTSATFTVRHAVAFVVGADDATHKLLYYFDLVNNQVVSSGTFALLDPTPQPKIQRAAS
jgi:hypothetical protein